MSVCVSAHVALLEDLLHEIDEALQEDIDVRLRLRELHSRTKTYAIAIDSRVAAVSHCTSGLRGAQLLHNAAARLSTVASSKVRVLVQEDYRDTWGLGRWRLAAETHSDWKYL